MKVHYRKNVILASSLIIMILLPVLFYAYLQVKQLIIVYQMEKKLENMHLQTISISVDSVTWYKFRSEIIVEGKMFDVKSFVLQDKIIIFSGLFDEEESDITFRMEQFEKEQQKNKPGRNLISKFFWNVFIDDSGRTIFPFSTFLSGVSYLSYYPDDLFSVNLSLPSPPPKPGNQ